MNLYKIFLKYAYEINPFKINFNINNLKKYQTSGPPLSDEFWTEFVNVSKRLNVDPEELAKVIRSESGFNTKAIAKNKSGNPIAKGLNQMTRVAAKAVAMPEKLWENYESLSGMEQLSWLEKFMKGQNISGADAVDIYIKNFGSHNNPDGSMYASLDYINAHPQKELFKNPELQDRQYKANKNIDMIYGNKDGAISKDDMIAFLKAQEKK